MSSNKLEVRATPRGWFVWSLSALAFGYAFFQRVTPGVMVSDLMRDFAIGGGMLGVLSALYFYPYFLLQVPLGALLDRFGARLLLFLALFLASMGSFLFGVAESLTLAYLGRILIGVGSAVGFLGSMTLASRWFPPHQFAFLTGLAMFLAMMCGVLGQAPLALFVDAYGWRSSQWGLGLFGLALALAIAVFVRNAPPQHGASEDSGGSVQTWSDMWRGLYKAATLWNTWKIAIVAAAMSGPMLALGGLWGVPYLMQTYDLSKPTAALLVSLLLVGWAIGAPISGWVSDRLQRRKGLIVSGGVFLTLGLALLVFIPAPPLALTVVILVLCGFFGSAMVCCFALVRETSPPEIAGSVTGIVNAMTVASGALLQPLVGGILDLVWDGTVVSGSRVYQAHDFQLAFISVLLAAATGLVLSLSIKEGR